MKTEITKLNHNGEGMTQIDGKIVFVPKTIPGDIVELTNLQDHKNFMQATCSHLYQESNLRVPVTCPYYKECGGCQLLELSYLEQLKYKQEKVANILKKYANIDIDLQELTIIKSPNQFHYRNKITLQVQNGLIGLFSYNTNNIVQINSCLLISEPMNQLIQIMQKNLKLDQVKQIIIREALNKRMVQIIGVTNETELIKTLGPHVDSLYLNNQHLYGKKYLIDKLEKYQFQISPNSFFQVNHDQTINLYNQIKTYLGPNNQNILDLYCGTGTIGIYVSEYCQKVSGIELNPSSVQDAKQNIAHNKLEHIQVQKGDVGKLLKTQNAYDAIIVDPPRSGLDKKTRQTLLQIKSPKIIYISCNPITLARDLKELKEIYELKEIKLFDMFPNTYHIESVVLLSLKK